jgi:predicted RND superfamily exporter protein
VVFADMLMAVVEDAPKAISVSIIATFLIVLLAFRGRLAGLWVIGSVVVGLTWTLGILMVYKSRWPWSDGGMFELEAMKLNFLNFVALPITIGVGADYAVNVMQRYRLAEGEMRRVIVETGGAVVLCSLTTMLGYSALTLSVNRAIQSFGVAAAAGEICCVLTGVLVLPAFLVWRSQRRKKR